MGRTTKRHDHSQAEELNNKSSQFLPDDDIDGGMTEQQQREFSSETFSTRPTVYDSTPTITSVHEEEEEYSSSPHKGGSVSREAGGDGGSNISRHLHNDSQSVSAQTIHRCNKDKGDKDQPVPQSEEESSSQVSKFRQSCGAMVNHPFVQKSIIFLICFNALTMGIATFDAVEDDDDLRRAFEKLDMVFLIIFTLELAMQLVYQGQNLFADGWLVFDFFVVVTSWSFDSFQVVRAFRIFRALRLIARLESLKSVISSLGQAAPSLGAVTFILVLVLYIFAVLCTELFSEVTSLDDDYFTRLDSSLLTLVEMMTLEWSGVARQVMVEHHWAWAVFVPFLVITNFALFSLVVAVVCDGVTVTEHGEHEDPEKTRQRVTDLLKQVDTLTKNQKAIVQSLQETLRALEELREKDKSELSKSKVNSR
uniref:Ion transport domain-containing protein n=1 Tax=Amphora coffeiformis TaxID=265554 RepID=A0A7S3L3S1_9STRA|mmetsp:Transcript_14816/g.28223  ORF Transcript_14816/g.28223 Transcript_14816/m.28223 type:complete len:422 (-) Transcript_14816:249-1514(-)